MYFAKSAIQTVFKRILFPVGTTKEHLGFALALRVPIFVVVTKIDVCRSCQVERTIKQLEKILKSPGCKKVPFRVEVDDDVIAAAENFHSDRYMYSLALYMLLLCNITGSGKQDIIHRQKHIH